MLTHLSIWGDFNQKIDKLPLTLIYLKLGQKFNKIINKLPPTLIYLKISSTYSYLKQQYSHISFDFF